MSVRLSGSFCRFLAPPLHPRPQDPELYERLRAQRFRPIDESAAAGPSCGWVVQGRFSSSDFRPETVFRGQALVLGMRLDEKKLPKNAVRVRLQKALADLGARAAPSARARLREEVEKELLARVVPATTLVDVLWRPRARALLVGTTAARVLDRFAALFAETFGRAPVPATPEALATTLAGDSIGGDRLARLSPLFGSPPPEAP